MNLQHLVDAPLWTPRASFPPSQKVSDRLFALGDGLYLMTNPVMGDGDPVRGVGWAESDYWAQRVWDNPFTGDLQAPPAHWSGPPSLEFLGRPPLLSFEAVCAHEAATGRAPVVTLVTARYRWTDGAFLSAEVTGADDIFYEYARTNPEPDDLPVAVEVRLPERK